MNNSGVKKNSIEQETEQLYNEKMDYKGKDEVVLQQKKQKESNLIVKNIWDDLKEERTYRNSEGVKEKVVVKIDTVIPTLPGKSERVKMPDEQKHYEALDKLDDEKDQLWEKFKKYAKEIKQQAFDTINNTSDGQGSLFNILRNKQTLRKNLRDQMKNIKQDFDIKKKELEDIWDKQSKMRLKMKRLMKKDELIALIEDLKFQQANHKMSLYDEKILVKSIQDLEESLPYAEPLEQMEIRRGPLKKEKDILGNQMKKIWEDIQILNKEIDELSSDYDNVKKSQNDQFDKLDPAIANKKKETQEKSESIRNQKKQLQIKFREQQNLFEDQNELIKKVEWMDSAQKRLIKYKQQLIEEEALKKKQEEERKDLQDNVYSEEIRMCEFLIRYCKQFQKKQVKNTNNIVDNQQTNQAIQDEKLQILCSKKDLSNDFSKKKPVKKTNTNKQTENKVEDNKIVHKLDVLDYFEQMKVTAPTKNKIDDAIKQLEDKKQYFTEQNEIKKKENVDVVEEEKKKIKEKEHLYRQKEIANEKKQKDKKSKMNAEFKDEEYPEMN